MQHMSAVVIAKMRFLLTLHNCWTTRWWLHSSELLTKASVQLNAMQCIQVQCKQIAFNNLVGMQILERCSFAI